jgi:polyphosphate kinase
VLAEARNTAYPLLERLRFLSISGSNLDEFMMIRVAGLAGQARRGIDTRSIDDRTPTQQLAEINRKVRHLEGWQQQVLGDLREKLASEGIRIVDANALRGEPAQWLQQFFIDDILPVLTPQAIDPAHPFPFIANLGMGILFNLTRRADGAGSLRWFWCHRQCRDLCACRAQRRLMFRSRV